MTAGTTGSAGATAGGPRGSGRVGVGVIGAGTISTQYLTTLTSFPDVDVKVVADLAVDRARAQAEAFGVPRWGAVQDVLDDPEVELVVNLTIPAAHVEVATAAVAAGKDVWTEKPFALDRASGTALLEAAARSRPAGRDGARHVPGRRDPDRPAAPGGRRGRRPADRAGAAAVGGTRRAGTPTRRSCSPTARARCSTSAPTT